MPQSVCKLVAMMETNYIVDIVPVPVNKYEQLLCRHSSMPRVFDFRAHNQ